MLQSSNDYDLVRTELDGIFYQELNNVDRIPGYCDVNTPELFHTKPFDKQAEILKTFAGVGLFEKTAETGQISLDTHSWGNKRVAQIEDFTKGEEISKNFFDDDQFESYAEIVRDIARKARATMNNNAFAIYRGMFGTTLTSDGVAFISASHPLLKGGTESNYVSGRLSGDILNQAINKFVTLKDQAGVISGNYPNTLLVELTDFKYAQELTQSALVADSGNNNINFFRASYGFKVFTSPWFSVAAGATVGSWVLLGNNHSVTRLVRQPLETSLTDWRFSKNRTYFYQAAFREVVYVKDYSGAVGGY